MTDRVEKGGAVTEQKTATAEPTVFVVDDDPGLCGALSYLVESTHLACETYPRAQDFLDAYDPARPGCLVLDVRMPGIGGLDFQDELVARGYTLPVIMITGYADVPMAVRAVKAGAVEFLEKPFSDQVILESIQQAIERDRQWRQLEAARADFLEGLERLTPRERQVMEFLLIGRTSKEIGAELTLSSKTVETHRANVMAKMQAHSLADLVRRSMLYGLAPPRPRKR